MSGAGGRESEPSWRGGPRLSIAVAMVGVLVGSVWRLEPAGHAFLFGDEFHSLRDIQNGYRYLFTHFSATGSGMALPILQRALGDAFGFSHWTIRLPALVGGLALLATVYPLARRRIGEPAAALVTLLVATSPLLIFYSHFGRSYALVAWLCLLLLDSLQRMVDGARTGLRRCAGCALLLALLPYVQPIALASAIPAFGGALVALWLRGRRQDAAALAGSLAAGLLGAALLHAPAQNSVATYFRYQRTTEYLGDFRPSDVAALLVGSRSGGAALAALLALALATMLVWRRARALPLVAGCLGPGFAIALVRPFGDAYAYARYALPMLPFAYVALGWFVAFLVCRVVASERARALVTLAVGMAGAAMLLATGPRGVRHTPDGPYANTYMGMYPLPAFDVLWDSAPAFYRELESQNEDLRIIEAPALVSRTRHLYRNHYLRHCKETWLGVLPSELVNLPEGPYVSLEDPKWREEADADYLILHVDVVGEVRRYWRFVYESHREQAEAPSVAALMTRHSRYHGYQTPDTNPPPALKARLREQLGEPIYADREILVWRLRAADQTAPGH